MSNLLKKFSQTALAFGLVFSFNLNSFANVKKTVKPTVVKKEADKWEVKVSAGAEEFSSYNDKDVDYLYANKISSLDEAEREEAKKNAETLSVEEKKKQLSDKDVRVKRFFFGLDFLSKEYNAGFSLKTNASRLDDVVLSVFFRQGHHIVAVSKQLSVETRIGLSTRIRQLVPGFMGETNLVYHFNNKVSASLGLSGRFEIYPELVTQHGLTAGISAQF